MIGDNRAGSHTMPHTSRTPGGVGCLGGAVCGPYAVGVRRVRGMRVCDGNARAAGVIGCAARMLSGR